MDDARRRPASRAASDEQLQRVVLRQLVHRQRSAMGMAAESRWRVQPGTAAFVLPGGALPSPFRQRADARSLAVLRGM